MRCPLTGKPCILPKEITVTNVEENEVNHLYLCKECGSEYLKLPTENVVTQMTSTPNGIVREVSTTPNNPPPELSSVKEEVFLPQEVENTKEDQISKLEKKMRRAIKLEKYEEAAKIRDEIKKMRNYKNE